MLTYQNWSEPFWQWRKPLLPPAPSCPELLQQHSAGLDWDCPTLPSPGPELTYAPPQAPEYFCSQPNPSVRVKGKIVLYLTEYITWIMKHDNIFLSWADSNAKFITLRALSTAVKMFSWTACCRTPLACFIHSAKWSSICNLNHTSGRVYYKQVCHRQSCATEGWQKMTQLKSKSS